MARKKQMSRKAGGTRMLSSAKPKVVWQGICKKGCSCILEHGHRGRCNEGDMSDEEYDVEEILNVRQAGKGIEVSLACTPSSKE